ncbi:MAG: DUF4870 domain-containing protein [Leeuwenhoekiella sp.]
METSITSHQKNVATFIHLSTFTKYIFPFGNFICPLILWMAQKKESAFIDNHGRRAINFQISMLIYTIGLILLALPFIIWQALQIAHVNNFYDFEDHFESIRTLGEVSGLLIIAFSFGTLLIGLFIIELVAVISAAINASRGLDYKYPLSINFIKQSPVDFTAAASA